MAFVTVLWLPIMTPAAAVWLLALDFQPLFEDHGIPLAIMGMLVVFAALVLVSLFITVLPRTLAGLARQLGGAKEPSAIKGSKSPAEDELSEEILVVISAAVAEAISKPHRIIRTREMTAEELGWSLEGRLQHHSSHNVRQRDRR